MRGEAFSLVLERGEVEEKKEEGEGEVCLEDSTGVEAQWIKTIQRQRIYIYMRCFLVLGFFFHILALYTHVN